MENIFFFFNYSLAIAFNKMLEKFYESFRVVEKKVNKIFRISTFHVFFGTSIKNILLGRRKWAVIQILNNAFSLFIAIRRKKYVPDRSTVCWSHDNWCKEF